MRCCLFEDRVENLDPLTLTRPVFELLCGMTSLGDKQRRAFAASAYGMLVRPALEALCRQCRPGVPVNDAAWLRSGPIVLINGRWLPSQPALAVPPAPCLGVVDEQVAYAVLAPAELGRLALDNVGAQLDAWQRELPCRQAGGSMIDHPWDLVDRNADAITRDFADLGMAAKPSAVSPAAVVGPAARLWIDPGARVEPMVIADTTQGPVVVDTGAVIHAFTRLEGPCYVGPMTQVHGAKIRAGTTLGPQCRSGGEVEASIVHGHSNKYHDGFLGHSYVGEWVNLGAGTHNSDLRNDYGEVTVTVGGVPLNTGLSKVGCFLGDHTKTGLGTLLNTGASIGAFCNLLPAGRYAPRYVPSFTSWWNGSLREAFTPEQLLATAELAMKRRGITLTEAQRALYVGLHAETAQERRRVLRENEQRALRRSA
jgi:UDP-N-acetylglucosamine diphosphorylase / glucose-1-phosphate thymidylyltransferase / UDP-N-acetylgalactosamine diphosphorylase / glucosamine-1-phosphate N-acetyltransferase / galactosamine-1-phosphate N-acetyltransferase